LRVTLELELIAAERPSALISVAELTKEQFEKLQQAARSSWIDGSAILVTRNQIVFGDKAMKQLVAVCTRAYDNVPERVIRRAPMTHAAAYADGTTDLISNERFNAIDRSTFVELPTAIENQTELQIEQQGLKSGLPEM
jgi:hypothetical protein